MCGRPAVRDGRCKTHYAGAVDASPALDRIQLGMSDPNLLLGTAGAVAQAAQNQALNQVLIGGGGCYPGPSTSGPGSNQLLNQALLKKSQAAGMLNLNRLGADVAQPAPADASALQAVKTQFINNLLMKNSILAGMVTKIQLVQPLLKLLQFHL